MKNFILNLKSLPFKYKFFYTTELLILLLVLGVFWFIVISQNANQLNYASPQNGYIYSDGKFVWLTKSTSSIEKLDYTTGKFISLVAGLSYNFNNISGIYSNQNSVWVSSYNPASITKFNGLSDSIQYVIKSNKSNQINRPIGLDVVGNNLWILNAGNNQLIKFNSLTGKFVASYNYLKGTGRQLLAFGDNLWLVSSNNIVKINGSNGQEIFSKSIQTKQTTKNIVIKSVVNQNYIWLLIKSENSTQLLQFNSSNGDELQSINQNQLNLSEINSMAVDSSSLWLLEKNQLIKLNAQTGILVSSYQNSQIGLTAQGNDIFSNGNNVWVGGKNYVTVINSSLGKPIENYVNNVSVNLSTNSSQIVSGGSITLTWTSSNATSCMAGGGWSGNQSLSGSTTINNLTSSTSYTLECTGSGGSDYKQVSVSILSKPSSVLNSKSTSTTGSSGTSNNNGQSSNGGTNNGGTNTPTPAAPVVNLSSNLSTIFSGGSITLTWTSSNATSCMAGGGWSGNQSLSGSTTINNLTSSTSYTLECTGSGGSSNGSVSIIVNPAPPTDCSASPATSASSLNGLTYPLIHTTTFTGLSFPSNFQSYGNGVQSPGGYIMSSHDVLTGSYLQVQGYNDGGYSSAVGAGFDLSDQVPSSGGFDICMSLSTNYWGAPGSDMHIVLISWPVDNVWGEGENDIFEGNIVSPQINVHEIGSNPSVNVYQGSWGSSNLNDGKPHLFSARWDPINGYTFWLDNKTKIGQSNAQTPTTAHHLSIQMQDLCECTSISKSSMVTANIYWTAAYSY